MQMQVIFQGLMVVVVVQHQPAPPNITSQCHVGSQKYNLDDSVRLGPEDKDGRSLTFYEHIAYTILHCFFMAHHNADPL